MIFQGFIEVKDGGRPSAVSFFVTALNVSALEKGGVKLPMQIMEVPGLVRIQGAYLIPHCCWLMPDC
jgi:hypothetical protein